MSGPRPDELNPYRNMEGDRLNQADTLLVEDAAQFGYLVTLFGLHLRSALLLVKQSRGCEKTAARMQNPMARPIFTTHQSYVVGAIFASVAYIEALINELYMAATRGSGEALVAPLSVNAQRHLATWWTTTNAKGNPSNQYAETLVKYDKALTSTGQQNFTGQTPRAAIYTRVDALRLFRNDLVHHKAETVPVVIGRLHNPIVENELSQAGVAYDPLSGPAASNGPYPVKYFSYSCAHWAITVSMDFVDTFYRRLAPSSQPMPPSLVRLHNDVRTSLPTP